MPNSLSLLTAVAGIQLVLIAALVAQWRRGLRARDLQALQHAGADARIGELVHELKQPLTAILSNAQAAQRFLASDRLDLQELREILDDIVTDDKRAAGIVRSIGGVRQETKVPGFDGAKVSGVGRAKVSVDEGCREVQRTANVGASKLPDSDQSGSRKERAQ